MKRAWCLAAIALVWIAQPVMPVEAAPAAAPVAAISVDIDDAAKTITLHVRLTIAADCGPGRMAARDAIPVLRRQCHVTQSVADAIKQAILKVWSGHTYKCYEVIFDVDVKVDDSTTPQPQNDRLMVRIDRSAANSWNWVSVVGRGSHAWNSNEQEALLLPTNDPDEGSTWSYPEPEGGHVFAHEFGHVLGLDEGYETVDGPDGKKINRERADAPKDVMTNEKYDTVDQATIDRVIERRIDKSKIKCDYKIDTMVSWYHFTSLKCGSAEGQWDIVVDGTYDLGGGTLVLTGSGTATLTKDQATKRFLGPWNAAFAVRLEGVPSAIGGQDGTLDGNAELVNHATLNLVGVNAQGTFFAQTPAKSIGGQADNPGKDFFLPVTNGRFC